MRLIQREKVRTVSEENTPYYPEQGSFIAERHVQTLLPAGMKPEETRVLFVHAHPDDESTATGASMSALSRAGAQVDLLTATRGEMGEVIPADFKHLEAWHPGTTDRGEALGQLRQKELSEALRILKVSHHEYLGRGDARAENGASIYRDSGMEWGEEMAPAWETGRKGEAGVREMVRNEWRRKSTHRSRYIAIPNTAPSLCPEAPFPCPLFASCVWEGGRECGVLQTGVRMRRTQMEGGRLG